MIEIAQGSKVKFMSAACLKKLGKNPGVLGIPCQY